MADSDWQIQRTDPESGFEMLLAAIRVGNVAVHQICCMAIGRRNFDGIPGKILSLVCLFSLKSNFEIRTFIFVSNA